MELQIFVFFFFKKKKESPPHNSQRIYANTDATNNTTKATHTNTTKDNQPQPNTKHITNFQHRCRSTSMWHEACIVMPGHITCLDHFTQIPYFSGVPTCCVICSACSSDRTQCASSCWHQRSARTKEAVVSEYNAIMIGNSSCPCQFVADKRRPVVKHGPRSPTYVCLCAEQAP